MISRLVIMVLMVGLCLSGCDNADTLARIPAMNYNDIIDPSVFKDDPLTEAQFYQAKARADLKAHQINLHMQGMVSLEFPYNLYELVFKQTLKGYNVSVHKTGCELQVKYEAYNRVVDSFLSERYGSDFHTKLQQRMDSLRKIPAYASMDKVVDVSAYNLARNR